HRSNAVTLGEPVTLEEQRLIFLQPVRLPQLGAHARSVVALDPSGVRDLASALGVEGRFAQLREEETVAEIFERTDLGEDLDLLVTHELGAKAGILRELGGPSVVLRDRATRPRALHLHQARELLLVDAEP